MDATAAEINQASPTADGKVTLRNRGARSMKRVVLLAVVVAAGAASVHPSPTLANVSSGSGSAYEWVYCNSNTHTITITTSSVGITSNQLVSSPGGLINYFLKYRVWLSMHEYVNGAWRAPMPFVQVPDGSHVIQFLEKAGATSYWYFTWAFEQPNGTIAYGGEWAQGMGSNGWYSDQRGYTTLTSCRS
jgi:hypothetical protein